MRQQVEVAIPGVDFETNALVWVALSQQDTVSHNSMNEICRSMAQVDDVDRTSQQPLQITSKLRYRPEQLGIRTLGQQHADIDVAVRALLASGEATVQVGADERNRRFSKASLNRAVECLGFHGLGRQRYRDYGHDSAYATPTHPHISGSALMADWFGVLRFTRSCHNSRARLRPPSRNTQTTTVAQ